MPQLDTSTWFISVLSVFLVLYILFQLKISKYIIQLIDVYQGTKTITSVNDIWHTQERKQLGMAEWQLCVCVKESESVSCSVECDSLQPYVL